MPNTDWTSIRDRLRENEEKLRARFDVRGNIEDALHLSETYTRTVLALAEAERMVEEKERAARRAAIRILCQSPAGMVNAHPRKTHDAAIAAQAKEAVASGGPTP